MKMIDEGYIKFNIDHTPAPPLPAEYLKDLIFWRDRLHEANLIGVYNNGIGFGNISKRFGNDFIISGTQTGHIKKGSPQHFSLVTETDILFNKVKCKGPVKASSESLTHAIFYKTTNDINAVIHIHNKEFWEKNLNILPTSDPAVPYGTPAMADAVAKILADEKAYQKRLILMGGHEEGILAFGPDLDAAGATLMAYFPIL